MSCSELFLNDVVRVDVYLDSHLTFAVPPTVPGITSMPPVDETIGSVSFAESGAHYETMPGGISVTEKTQNQSPSVIYTYNIDINAYAREGEQMKTDHEPDIDLSFVLTKTDGTKRMIYALPGSIGFSIESDGKTARFVFTCSTCNRPILLEGTEVKFG